MIQVKILMPGSISFSDIKDFENEITKDRLQRLFEDYELEYAKDYYKHHKDDRVITPVYFTLEQRINSWLRGKPDIKIIDIKHTLAANEGFLEEYAMIIYKVKDESELVPLPKKMEWRKP